MFSFKALLKMLVITCVLLATASAASTPVSTQTTTGPDVAMKTTLQPDLTLRSTLSLPLLPQDTNNSGKGGFCLGACTVRCTTNADCGPGGLCKPFIICETARIQWNEGIGLSSHRGEVPALNVKCK